MVSFSVFAGVVSSCPFAFRLTWVPFAFLLLFVPLHYQVWQIVELDLQRCQRTVFVFAFAAQCLASHLQF